MQGKGCLGEIELTSDFPVGGIDPFLCVVHIYEEEGIPPAVGAEELHGRGELGACSLLLAVELLAKVVVKLDVLRLCSEGSEQEDKSDTIEMSHKEYEG